MTAREVKANLPSLLDDLMPGEEVEITRNGRIVARLVRTRDAHSLKGLFAGIVTTNASDEELMSTGEEWESS